MVKVDRKKRVKVLLREFADPRHSLMKTLTKANPLVRGVQNRLGEHLQLQLATTKEVTVKPACIIREGASKTSLHCRPNYYGHPRFDFATVEIGGVTRIVSLNCFLEIEINQQRHLLAGVEELQHIQQHPTLLVPKLRGKGVLDFVPIHLLQGLSPVIRDMSQPGTYFENTYFAEFEQREYDPE